MYQAPAADPYALAALHYTRNTLRVWLWRLLVNLLVSGIGFAVFLVGLRWLPELFSIPDIGFINLEPAEALQRIPAIAAPAGMASGMLHWLLLTRRLKGALLWCLSYWITWTLGFMTLWLFRSALGDPVLRLTAMALVLSAVILVAGMAAGVSQWFILRRHIVHPKRWVLTNIAGQLGVWLLLLVSLFGM